MFSISAQGKSAKAEIDDLLYKHSYCIASATITTIPIYYLEPNTRIYLYDKDRSVYMRNSSSIKYRDNDTWVDKLNG